ncbi:MAG: ChbG/HpnK family deacetylase [Myxococcales bacterium]|nr:ChbG/HpnK family deacetylase [Myxococcales bacterium]
MGRLLIINADDFGYERQISRGVLEAVREGIVTSATLIANAPDSEEAARLAKGFPVGLHLNLARFGPVWSGFPRGLLDSGELVETRAGELPPEVVEAEAKAQLDRLESLLGRPATHLDVHRHLHRHPGVLEGVGGLARRRNLPVRSIDPAMRARLMQLGVATNDHFLGEAGPEPYWTLVRLRECLEALPQEGVTELMCHPGYAPRDFQSGYSKQREKELETFTHPGAKAMLARLSIPLGDWRSVR